MESCRPRFRYSGIRAQRSTSASFRLPQEGGHIRGSATAQFCEALIAQRFSCAEKLRRSDTGDAVKHVVYKNVRVARVSDQTLRVSPVHYRSVALPFTLIFPPYRPSRRPVG